MAFCSTGGVHKLKGVCAKDMWGICGGHLEECRRTCGKRLKDIRRILEWAHLYFEFMMLTIVASKLM